MSSSAQRRRQPLKSSQPNPGECLHEAVWNDLCAQCGKDLKEDVAKTIDKKAIIPIIHSNPSIRVKETVIKIFE